MKTGRLSAGAAFRFAIAAFWALAAGCAHYESDSGPAGIRNVAKDPFGDEKWVLGSVFTLPGSDYVAALLVSEKENVDLSRSASFSISGMEQCGYGFFWSLRCRNVLFVNTSSNEGRWLFKDNNQLVVDFSPNAFSDFGREAFRQGPPVSSKTILYRVVSEDANGDGMLDQKDSSSLAISKDDGTNFKVLVRGCERVVHSSEVSGDRLFIVYQCAGEGRSMVLNLKTFDIVSDVELPRVPE